MLKQVLAGTLAMLAASVMALTDIPLPTDGSFYDGPVIQARIAALQVLMDAADAKASTNATLTITRQANASVTNGTIDVTFVPVWSTNTWVYLDAGSNVVTNSVVTLSSATATAVFTPQVEAVKAVTNVVITIQRP